MRDPILGSHSGNDSTAKSTETESWFNRVRENLEQVLKPSHLKPYSANGAPIHLLKFDKSPRPARAQGLSAVTHATVFAALLLLVARGPGTAAGPSAERVSSHGPLDFNLPVFSSLANEHSASGSGSGGDANAIPATRGNLPPFSSIALVKPTLPQEQHANLPVPPTIFDPSAAPTLTPTENMGLPWMQADTNSSGPGKKHGIGSGDDGTLGDGGPGPAGYGSANNPYAPGMVAPGCAYCPYPTYTDDARHGKVQGSVTLQVLVGVDGRAHAIRMVKGIGFGLDERAVETVQGWKFTPARDGAGRAVAAWVTVEAVFRLF